MRGRGTVDPSRNPNSYPMTDSYKYPSMVKVRVNGRVVDLFYLEDDPADHRGVLSWHSQLEDGKLREAGSYGYLLKSNIPMELVRNAADRRLNIRFEVDDGLPAVQPSPLATVVQFMLAAKPKKFAAISLKPVSSNWM